MALKGRRAGGAAFAVMGICLALSGCVQTESAFMGSGDFQRPGGMATVSTGMPGSSGDVQQTSYRPLAARNGLQPMDTLPADENAPAGPGLFPRELTQVSHPPRPVAPPDVLLIDAIRLVPKGPYRLEPLEVLQIAVTGTLPNEPIAGPFMISPEGTVNLGFSYGAVRVGSLTLDQAEEAIRKHLVMLKNPQVNLGLVQFRGIQQIRGEHLVRPDGTISLGMYGSVYVSGMTLGQVKCEVEKYLSAYLVNPQLSVDILSYNSQKYYVIFDGGGYGQKVFPLPITGNETVLDAISRVGGLDPVSSTKRIVLSRPSPVAMGCNQVLPIDWMAILHGSTATNYQIFPGDRIYVGANCLITLDNRLAQVLAPLERIFGATLLGTNAVQSVRFFNSGTSNTGFFVGGVGGVR